MAGPRLPCAPWTFGTHRKRPPARATALATSLVVALSLSGCDDSATEPHDDDDGQILTFDVEEVTVAEGASVELKVLVMDSSGAVAEQVAPSEVSWSSSHPEVASVDSGEVTGEAPGVSTIEASKEGAESASVEVHVESAAGGGSALRPNEPEGLSPWFHHDMRSLPDGPASHEGAVAWTTYESNYTIEDVDPADHPLGRSQVLQIRFPEGHPDGASPGAFGAVDQGSAGTSTELDEWYVSVHVKLVGPDWEAPPSDQKLWYNQIGNRDTHQGGYVSLRGGGQPNTLTTEWPFIQSQYRTCPGCVGDINTESVPGGFSVGDWHHIELWRSSSDPDSANGEMKVWVDGDLVVDLDDVVDQSSENGDWTTGFYSLRWAPVWGGVCSGGCPKTRDDFMLLGDMYVSGVRR